MNTVLVSGASSGFGLGIARAFAQAGWKVVATVRSAERVPAGASADIEWLVAEFEQPEQVVALARRVDQLLNGRLDCLVNNAGYALIGPFSTCSEAQMRTQMQVNFLAPAVLTQALLPALETARGRIINISSVLGETGMPLNALYCASKHAVEGWSKALRHELAARGIQVASVAPGGFRTRFGDNLHWGELPCDHPADRWMRDNLRAVQSRRRARPGADPSAVVSKVLRLAQRRRMPSIVRVGSDARLLHVVQRLLPRRCAEALLGSIYRAMLLRRAPR